MRDPNTKNYLRCLLLGGGFSNRGKGLLEIGFGSRSWVRWRHEMHMKLDEVSWCVPCLRAWLCRLSAGLDRLVNLLSISGAGQEKRYIFSVWSSKETVSVTHTLTSSCCSPWLTGFTAAACPFMSKLTWDAEIH